MKSLRSTGRLSRRARRRDVRVCPKRGCIGQHREARRAALLVGSCQCRRIKIGADEAARRACLLDLGNERVVAGRRARARSRAQIREGPRLPWPRLRSHRWPRALGRRDFLALIGLDLGEDVHPPVPHAFDTGSAAAADHWPRRNRPISGPAQPPASSALARPATINPGRRIEHRRYRGRRPLALEHVAERLRVLLCRHPRAALRA